tara:strand:+ start:3649 stop:3861 length:213 start_codon:yes stop_codon:yes gene_type:complete
LYSYQLYCDATAAFDSGILDSRDNLDRVVVEINADYESSACVQELSTFSSEIRQVERVALAGCQWSGLSE